MVPCDWVVTLGKRLVISSEAASERSLPSPSRFSSIFSGSFLSPRLAHSPSASVGFLSGSQCSPTSGKSSINVSPGCPRRQLLTSSSSSTPEATFMPSVWKSSSSLSSSCFRNAFQRALFFGERFFNFVPLIFEFLSLVSPTEFSSLLGYFPSTCKSGPPSISSFFRVFLLFLVTLRRPSLPSQTVPSFSGKTLLFSSLSFCPGFMMSPSFKNDIISRS